VGKKEKEKPIPVLSSKKRGGVELLFREGGLSVKEDAIVQENPTGTYGWRRGLSSSTSQMRGDGTYVRRKLVIKEYLSLERSREGTLSPSGGRTAVSRKGGDGAESSCRERRQFLKILRED